LKTLVAKRIELRAAAEVFVNQLRRVLRHRSLRRKKAIVLKEAAVA